MMALGAITGRFRDLSSSFSVLRHFLFTFKEASSAFVAFWNDFQPFSKSSIPNLHEVAAAVWRRHSA